MENEQLKRQPSSQGSYQVGSKEGSLHNLSPAMQTEVVFEI